MRGEQHRAAVACCKPGDDADDQMLIQRRRPASETASSLRPATARTTASRSRCASRDGCPRGGGRQEGDPGRPPPAPAGAALGCSAATSMSQPARLGREGGDGLRTGAAPTGTGRCSDSGRSAAATSGQAVASSRQPPVGGSWKGHAAPAVRAPRRARPGPAAGRDKPEPRPLWIARGQPCEYPRPVTPHPDQSSRKCYEGNPTY